MDTRTLDLIRAAHLALARAPDEVLADIAALEAVHALTERPPPRRPALAPIRRDPPEEEE